MSDPYPFRPPLALRRICEHCGRDIARCDICGCPWHPQCGPLPPGAIVRCKECAVAHPPDHRPIADWPPA
jgi:hypothetical protein